MAFPLLPVIMGGASLLGGLFGGGGKWRYPPYLEEALKEAMAEYRSGKTPEAITGPITQAGEQEKARIKNWFSSNLPAGTATGNELATTMQSEAGTKRELGYAGERYRSGLLSQILGAGSGGLYEPSRIGELFGGLGGNLAWLIDAMKKKGSGLPGAGTGLEYAPGFLS